MRHDALDLDFESFLDCPEKDESEVLQRLSSALGEIKSWITATVETHLAQEKEYDEKCKADSELITQLHSVKKDMAVKLDNIILAQKVQEKKIAIAMKQQVELRNEIDVAKSRKESISLEMVDLDQELKDGRRLKKDRWNAIKKACSVYKNNLNFHIEYLRREDADFSERVKVTFFIHSNPHRDNYYVYLLNYNNSWKVGQVEPALKEIHLEELKAVVDTAKPLDVPDVIVYLCKLRNIFSKHYFK